MQKRRKQRIKINSGEDVEIGNPTSPSNHAVRPPSKGINLWGEVLQTLERTKQLPHSISQELLPKK